MAKKFTEVEKGAFQKLGKEYDYIVELGEDFNGKKDVRARIVEEKPIIKKVRTRYDPEIQLFGDKKASMNVSLGYNMKDIDSRIKVLFHVFLMPIYSIGLVGFFGASFYYLFKLPSGFIPKWSLFILTPLLLVLVYFSIKGYFKIVLNAMAEYFKAKDIKNLLLKEGYKK
jgi:hypothetical protein